LKISLIRQVLLHWVLFQFNF